MGLTREDILSSDDLATDSVEIPKWGGEVHVREMNGVERAKVSDMFARFEGGDVNELESEEDVEVVMKETSMSDMLEVLSYIACKCVIDEDGERLFTDDDQEELKKKDPAALRKIQDKVTEISDFGAEETEAAKKN